MKIFARAFSVLVSLGFVGFLAYSLVYSTEFIVPQVSVVSEDASRSSFVFEKISIELSKELEKFAGLPIWKISVAEIHELLQNDDRLESFRVKRSFPNRLEVSLLPKRPLAVVLYGSSRMYPLSTDGSLLPEVALSASPDLPIIRGLKKGKDSEQRKQMVAVLSMLPNTGHFSKANVSELYFSRHGSLSFVMSSSQTKVLIGKKLSKHHVGRIEQVMKYLQSRSIKGRVIDARFSKKVVVRVRKDS